MVKAQEASTNINDYRFVFTIKSPHWDDKDEWKQSEPITLGEILEYGLTTEITFRDGGYITADQIDWETDTVIVGYPREKKKSNQVED